MNKKRTHQCGTLRESHVGEEVVLLGWIQRRRDLGGVIFIDVRDRSGIVQVVFNPEYPEALAFAERVRNEYVVRLIGKIVRRDPETVNPKLETGQIEVLVHGAEVINAAKNPPFMIEDDIDVDESVRLKYRYLDLRRPHMQQNLMLRHKAAKLFRDFLDQHGFLEIETPMLTKSTPEGARDYLVPSRVHPGQFFALPQSPQIFKQLLMVSGFERYFQIVRCFRDEDLRADRQPEFTQVDIETSFMEMEDLLALMEELMAKLLKEIMGVEVSAPFKRISYDEAMGRYGSDKPDLRFGMELVDVGDIAQNCSFKVFSGAIANGGQVKGINVKGSGHYSRKDVDILMEFAAIYGAKGLAWIAFHEGEVKGPISKFFSNEEMNSLKQALQAEEGDLLLFVADSKKVVADTLGALRLKFAKELNLINEKEFNFLWVTDFPLVEYDAEQKRYVALHHPFTSPRDEDISLFDSQPEQMKAKAYDLVLNGFEVGGGSMRIYKRDIQERMFAMLGLSQEEAQEKFGFLLDAFDYGTPPHGGIAFGFDRLIMLLAGSSNLRETIAFPKTASASCLLTQAPGEVSDRQLEELSLRPAIRAKV
jgi:aspartyl-tRNA synthetase